LDKNFISQLSEEEKIDLSDKLINAGYPTTSNQKDLSNSFLSFIEDKNLGDKDREQVWESLINFGYNLGDRLLNLSNPALFGSDVEEVQEILSQLGFYSGTHTSIYSEELERAVEKFQENRGLVVDGNVGLDTAEELKSMLRPGKRSSLNNAMNLIGSKEIFANKQKHNVCFYIPMINDYKARSHLYEDIEKSCILSNINPIFASDLNKEIELTSIVAFVNKIQPSFFVYLVESEKNDINFFSGKHSESTLGKLLAKNLKGSLGLPTRGSSSEILTKTKPPTVIINLSVNKFGKNYQNIKPELISSALTSSIKEIDKNLT
tara:strand:- start:255 stop:1214 length:960 start_codon:yes stop_codon:yes gene_type:complete